MNKSVLISHLHLHYCNREKYRLVFMILSFPARLQIIYIPLLKKYTIIQKIFEKFSVLKVFTYN